MRRDPNRFGAEYAPILAPALGLLCGAGVDESDPTVLRELDRLLAIRAADLHPIIDR